MKLRFRLILCSFLIVAIASPAFAREWHGIVPLRSTRADVIKLLGPPRHLLWDYRDYFELDNTIITFSWIDPTCERKYPITPDASIQAADLVLGISLRLKQPVASSEFDLPEKNKFYFTSCFGGARGSCVFWDDGFSYSTSNGLVTGLGFGPSKDEFSGWEQTHPRCVRARDGL